MEFEAELVNWNCGIEAEVVELELPEPKSAKVGALTRTDGTWSGIVGVGTAGTEIGETGRWN